MQLDRTYIAIRERDLLDIMDLSLHVLRVFLRPLTVTFLLGVLPLWAWQHYLLGGFELLGLEEDPWFYDSQWRFWAASGVVVFAIFFAPLDRKSTRLNSSHSQQSRMPSSA